MQSNKRSLASGILAVCVAAIALVLAVGLRQGAAAFLWTLLWGAILGFIAPRGAWRWVLLLGLWIVIAVPTGRITEQPLCPSLASGPRAAGWWLLLVPPFAVYAGVFADWIVTLGLHKLEALGWGWLALLKPLLRFGATGAAALIVLVSCLGLGDRRRG